MEALKKTASSGGLSFCAIASDVRAGAEQSADFWSLAHLPPPTALVLFWPKAKALARLRLAQLAEQAPLGVPLYVVGAGDAGIKSADKVIRSYFGEVQKLAVGHHSQIWQARLIERCPPQGLRPWFETIETMIDNVPLQVASLPGVFSHGEVDAGTLLLLQHCPLLPERARVLDFGCGSGVIGAWLQKCQPELRVTALDCNVLALAATQETFRLNGLPEPQLVLADGLAGGPYDVVNSNLPFHTGRAVDLSLAAGFFAGLKACLAPEGRVLVVANRFLAYREPMAAALGRAEVVADDGRYWVLKN